MASCLGISVGKNLIKYAKASKDKSSAAVRIEAYGIKFYDVLTQTLAEIIQETKSADAEISVCLTSDFYEYTECYRNMNKKERAEFLQAQFEDECQKKGLNAGNYDVRFVFAENITSPEMDKVICVGASRVELKNLWSALSNYKFQSISGIGSTVVNLLPDKGAGQNCFIVNIEDETKLTRIKNGKIIDMIQIPVGMDEVITRLADKYNSYSKAYEACKGVDAYADTDIMGIELDDEEQGIRDALMPTLYDLKQRIIMEVDPYLAEYTDVYITGTGIIVNNIDLYLAEAFPGKHVEILVPYFVNKERTNLKDVLEVNSALAASTYCLTGVDKQEDFLLSGSTLKAEVSKKQFSPKVIFTNIKEKIDEVNKKTLKTRKSSKKKKKNIEFDNEVENLEQLGGAGEFVAPSSEEDVEYYDPMAEWFARLAFSLFAATVVYTLVVFGIQTTITEKTNKVNENIAKTNYAIEKANNDRIEIQKKSDQYRTKMKALERVIALTKLRRERSYDVPNFMSQLMFIIPIDVKVSSISIGTNDAVVLEAESGRYAQLGYFVSRLKLAGILKDVDMEVIDMSSSIQIKVSGVLP